MKRLISILMTLALFTSHTDARTWTDVEGRKIEGEFLSQNETHVILRLPGRNQPVPVPLERLSGEDREFLRNQAAQAAAGAYAPQWTGNFEPGIFEETLPFLVRIPKELQAGTKYPLLLFLHGAGERGNDNRSQLKHDPTQLAPAGFFQNNPMIVVAPQCPSDQWWSGQTLDAAIRMVKHMQKELPVDPQRIYITGLSMGGFGTWSAFAQEPGLFAAAIPICGGGAPDSVKKFVDVPIWAFHGDADPTVKVETTRAMIEALKKAGGQPKYTEYPGVKHDSWTRTYKDPAVYEWLISQKKPE